MSKRIYISPSWAFHDDRGEALNPQLFTLLSHIKETGKLTKAAALANISYRHGWNLLDQAHQFLAARSFTLKRGEAQPCRL